MAQTAEFPWARFPPDVLGIITSYLIWDDLSTLYSSMSAVVRHKMCAQSGVTHLQIGNLGGKNPSNLWPTNRVFPHSSHLTEPIRPCPFLGLTTLVVLEVHDTLRLDLFPPTITSLDLQSTYVTEHIMPHFTDTPSGPPTPLSKLFPSLLRLSLLSLPRRRVLGLTMKMIRASPVVDFFTNLPSTLTSLQFDAYAFEDSWQHLLKMPPNLVELGIGGSFWNSRPQPDFDSQIVMRASQFTSLLLWNVQANESIRPLLKSLTVQRLAFTSITLPCIKELPKTLTRLGLSIPYNPEAGNAPWPASLTSFDFSGLASTFALYFLPVQACHFYVAQGFHDNLGPVTAGWLAGIQQYTNLISFNISTVPVRDDALLAFPPSVKTLHFNSLSLTGYLYVNGKVPTVWSDATVRKSARLFLAQWDKLLLLNTPKKNEVIAPEMIPEGVLEIEGMPLLAKFGTKLPSTLTSLPKSYVPSDEKDFLALPRDLTSLQCSTVTLTPSIAEQLPKNLTKLETVQWDLSSFHNWSDLWKESFSSDTKVLTFPDDVAPMLERKYIPHVKLTSPSTVIDPKTLDALPAHITALRVTGGKIWPKMGRHEFPTSLTSLQVDHFLSFPIRHHLPQMGTITSTSAKEPSSSKSKAASAAAIKEETGPTPNIHHVLAELPSIKHVTLAGRAASSFLFDVPEPAFSLPHLETLTINLSSDDVSTPNSLALLTPNLRKLAIIGRPIAVNDKDLETFVPKSLTSLELETSTLTADASNYLPTTLTELNLHTLGKDSGHQTLARIRKRQTTRQVSPSV